LQTKKTDMLKGILSISGKSGLYKMVSQAKNSVIVESLIDGKRMAAHSFTKVVSLEDIAIFTETAEKPLAEVFKSIIENEDSMNLPDIKTASNDVLKSLFEVVLPDYDKERVYISDIKKVFSWYLFLKERDLLKEEPTEETKTEETQE
jgi:hypothetical protein